MRLSVKFFLFSAGMYALAGYVAVAQKVVEQTVEFWPQYYFQTNLDSVKHWSFASDYSHRYNDHSEKVQWIGRLGFNYQFNKCWSFSAGYAYSEYFSLGIVRRENRPWQQINYSVKLSPKLKFSNRMRLEERFIKDPVSSKFNYRLRNQFTFQTPIWSKDKALLFVSDEPMINFGSALKGLNKFDQNRLQAGLQFKISKEFYITPAYQYILQIKANKIDYKSIDVWRAGIMYRIE